MVSLGLVDHRSPLTAGPLRRLLNFIGSGLSTKRATQQALPKTILARRLFLIQKFGASRREIQNSKTESRYMATD